jgi:hypothetical protein
MGALEKTIIFFPEGNIKAGKAISINTGEALWLPGG